MKQIQIQIQRPKPQKIPLIKILINNSGDLCLTGSLYERASEIDTGEYPLTYDANGNLISGFNKIYTYNNFNQLIQVNNSNGVISSYLYDYNGNRIKKTDYNTNTTTYYVDASFIQVVNSSGTYNETYYYDSRDLVAKKDNNGELTYYHPDHLGSTSLITNQSGDIVENTFYMPYGEVISGGEDRYGYTSKEKDTETNLNYYGARYYDSYSMHFTQADPMMTNLYNPQDLNSYDYVRNNPYSNKDESGTLVAYFGGVITGGFGFGVSTSAGVVISATFSKGIQVGTYSKYAGGFVTPTASTGVEFGISPFQEEIKEFGGTSYDIGFDVGEVGSIGGSVSVPYDKTTSEIYWSKFSIGGTVSGDINPPIPPASGYATVSSVNTNPLFEFNPFSWLNNLFGETQQTIGGANEVSNNQEEKKWWEFWK